jgi:hypothetical protein
MYWFKRTECRLTNYSTEVITSITNFCEDSIYKINISNHIFCTETKILRIQKLHFTCSINARSSLIRNALRLILILCCYYRNYTCTFYPDPKYKISFKLLLAHKSDEIQDTFTMMVNQSRIPTWPLQLSTLHYHK